ncbi:MAG: cupredoxin domain-containing protein [Armatimonadota bacterium]|nr:cupredoxin domain-containing protein [Armatimonadota bacterium]
MTHRTRTLAVAALAAAVLLLPAAQPVLGAPAVRRYQVVMKFWKATVAEVSTIAVTNLPADAFAYAGETVEFVVRNDSPIPEGFAIDAFGVKEVLQPKETKTVRIRNVRPGAYTIYCHLHPMSVHYTGTLLVAPRR